MRNKLTDLNNHLFEQLERLNDEDLTAEELDKEIRRAKAMSEIATDIINNGQLLLNASKYANELCYNVKNQQAITNMLGYDENEK